MPKRMKHAAVAAAALATIGLGAAAFVQASSGSGEKEQTVTGPAATKAERAALRATKGGTVNAVERDDDGGGARWEVEVTKPDGSTTDVELDADLKVVASEDDGEGADERDDDERESEGDAG
jgi:uncharacterized membrane protein YkoI